MKTNVKQAKALCKVVSDDPYRPSLMRVLLSKDGAKFRNGPSLIATNGHMLAAIPVDVEAGDAAIERDYLLNTAVLSKIEPLTKKSEVAPLIVNGNVSVPTKLGTINAEIEKSPGADGEYFETYPNVASVLPDVKTITLRIGVNAEYLAALAKALGSEQVVLEIRDTERAITVRPTNKENDAVGLLMPVRVEGGK